jgi:hypothetical protein
VRQVDHVQYQRPVSNNPAGSRYGQGCARGSAGGLTVGGLNAHVSTTGAQENVTLLAAAQRSDRQHVLSGLAGDDDNARALRLRKNRHWQR